MPDNRAAARNRAIPPPTIPSSSPGSTRWRSSPSPTASSGATAPRRRSSASPRRRSSKGILIPLNPEKRPGCYLHRSQPERRRARRAPHLHLHADQGRGRARPTTGWRPTEAYAKLGKLFDGSMKGRTMYVVPYVMGPARLAVLEGRRRAHRQHLRRAQHADHDAHGQASRSTCSATANDFNRGLHSHARPQPRAPLHLPLPAGQHDLVGRLRLRRQRAARQEVPRAAHRHATSASKEGWLAEHMLILGVESPEGEMTLRRGGVPERVRQDQLRDDDPARSASRAGRSATVGDDIAWMRVGADGRLWAVNPETGYFGVAPGTSMQDEPERDEDASRATRSSPTSR